MINNINATDSKLISTILFLLLKRLYVENNNIVQIDISVKINQVLKEIEFLIFPQSFL